MFGRFGIPTQPAFAIVVPDGEVQTIFGAVGDDVLDAILNDAIGA